MSERGAIVVTGASTGIGLAAVALLARDGYAVFTGVRNEQDAERLAKSGEGITPLMLDVTVPESIAAAAATVGASGRPLAALVNNAGIAVGGPIAYLPLEHWRRQFDVNLFGTIAVTQAFLPLLSRGSRIVFVGSISGRLAVPYISPYSASKFALRALTDALRVELAPQGIGVSLIEPSSVKTPIWEKGRASRDRLIGLIPDDAPAHYRKALTSIIDKTADEERTGMPADDVAEAIKHAITAARPRGRYLLGTRARLGRIVALLPLPLRERVVRGSMGLP